MNDIRMFGCNRRETRFGEVCGAFSDNLDTWNDDVCREMIEHGVSMKSHIREVKDQGQNGSCATESTTGSVQLIREFNGREFVKLNPLSLYAFTHASNRGGGGGSSIDSNLARARDEGILPESVWPRSKGWHEKPPQDLMEEHAAKYRIDEFWDVGNISEVRTALLAQLPVVFGWRGHSCCLVELISMEEAIYLNSWGSDWGDDGLGRIKLSDIDFRYGAFAVRSVTDAG